MIVYTLSHETTEADVAAAAEALGRALREMETTVRFLPWK